LSHPVPEQITQALEELGRVLQSVEGQPVDPLTAEWAVVERGIARLLGGAFDPQKSSHGDIAFVLSIALGERLRRDLDGFWFRNRAAPAGLSLGFADAILMVSPFELSVQALRQARLALFDQAKQDLGEALARAKTGQAASLGEHKLGPDDYRHLFDPGLVQLVALESAKAESAWRNTAGQNARDIEAAVARLPARVPVEVRQEMQDQLLGVLRRLDQDVPLRSQIGEAPAMFELVGLLHGLKQATSFAAVELWQGILLPLLHIGAAQDFPPLDEEDLGAFRRGVDPLLIYIETVPFQTPAADEDGLLGVFPAECVAPVDPAFQDIPAQRLLKVSPEPLAKLCDTFEASAVRASLARFTTYLEEKAGGAPPASEKNGGDPAMIEVALAFLSSLVDVMRAVRDDRAALCIRRATAAEASSEDTIGELRQALQAGRIILV